MKRDFAHIATSGPVRYGQFPFAIGVLEAPDKFMPIGMWRSGLAGPRVAWRLGG
jgi:hypothetical protein